MSRHLQGRAGAHAVSGQSMGRARVGRPGGGRPGAGADRFDRRGGDYLNFQIRNGDPAVCAARCERDARCRAWSFSYPRTENAFATCWLKNKVPPRGGRQMLRVGRARGRRDRAAARPDRIFDRPYRRRLSQFRYRARRRPAPPARRPAKATTAAAPGPMCGPAISARPRAAISRTRSRARATSRAAFPAWCGNLRHSASGAQHWIPAARE